MMMRWVSDDRLSARILELLFAQATGAFVSGGIAGFVLVYAFWDVAENAILILWAMAYSAITAYRFYLSKRYAFRSVAMRSSANWYVKLGGSIFFAGSLWGAIIFYLAPHSDGVLGAILIANVAFLLAGAVTAYAVSYPVFLIFSLPIILASVLHLASPFDARSLLLAAITLGWYLFMMSSARRFGEFAVRALGYEYKNQELVAELEEQNWRAEVLAQELMVLSNTDSLTGLFNRRYFDERLEKELARTLRSGASLSLILADVDFFKIYNDSCGHLEGDKCLKRVADVLLASVRDGTDVVARFGGEEFGIILTETKLDEACVFAGRLGEALRHCAIAHPGSPVSDDVTLSMGVSSTRNASDAETLIDLADKALYRAKALGRNRVQSA